MTGYKDCRIACVSFIKLKERLNAINKSYLKVTNVSVISFLDLNYKIRQRTTLANIVNMTRI